MRADANGFPRAFSGAGQSLCQTDRLAGDWNSVLSLVVRLSHRCAHSGDGGQIKMAVSTGQSNVDAALVVTGGIHSPHIAQFHTCVERAVAKL